MGITKVKIHTRFAAGYVQEFEVNRLIKRTLSCLVPKFLKHSQFQKININLTGQHGGKYGLGTRYLQTANELDAENHVLTLRYGQCRRHGATRRR